MTITKEYIIKKIAEEMNCSIQDATNYVDGILTEIKESLKKNDPVMISGFGKFVIVNRVERMGINPQTKKPIRLRSHATVAFRTSGKLRELLNAEQETDKITKKKTKKTSKETAPEKISSSKAVSSTKGQGKMKTPKKDAETAKTAKTGKTLQNTEEPVKQIKSKNTVKKETSSGETSAVKPDIKTKTPKKDENSRVCGKTETKTENKPDKSSKTLKKPETGKDDKKSGIAADDNVKEKKNEEPDNINIPKYYIDDPLKADDLEKAEGYYYEVEDEIGKDNGGDDDLYYYEDEEDGEEYEDEEFDDEYDDDDDEYDDDDDDDY
ncbi:MAG: HU family DNA-binding protein [Deltaproteobacteria bacterium]|jgi:nucleoid DNA-binding protein|nr:HU family DNA-binding protein [Deltaproteobacteria bacterium]